MKLVSMKLGFSIAIIHTDETRRDSRAAEAGVWGEEREGMCWRWWTIVWRHVLLVQVPAAFYYCSSMLAYIFAETVLQFFIESCDLMPYLQDTGLISTAFDLGSMCWCGIQGLNDVGSTDEIATAATRRTRTSTGRRHSMIGGSSFPMGKYTLSPAIDIKLCLACLDVFHI